MTGANNAAAMTATAKLTAIAITWIALVSIAGIAHVGGHLNGAGITGIVIGGIRQSGQCSIKNVPRGLLNSRANAAAILYRQCSE